MIVRNDNKKTFLVIFELKCITYFTFILQLATSIPEVGKGDEDVFNMCSVYGIEVNFSAYCFLNVIMNWYSVNKEECVEYI